jgi:hypothetical protein
MIGYDTVHFFLEATSTNQADLANVANLLGQESLNRETGEVWSTGYVRNLRVSVGGAGVSVKGSVASFFNATNTQLVGRTEISQAVEKLGDTLNINMSNAKVTRLDVCSNFITQNAPKAYLDILGSLTYFQRIQATQNTLYYQRGKENIQSLCFYDKQIECHDTRKELPAVYAIGENMLRYEARFNSRLPKQFNRQEVTASTLANREFYNEVVGKWGQLYFSINKFYNTITMTKIKTVSEAKDYIFAVALSNMGANDVDRMLTEMKSKGVFADRKYYTRLKKSLEEVSEKFVTTGSNDLARELDDEVRTVLAYK